MSRRGGANHYDPRRNQLSPAISQQSSANAQRSGRGRGANHPDSRRNQPSPVISQQSSTNAALSGRGGHTVPSSTPTPVTVTASSSTSSPVIYHPSVVAPVTAGSSSVSTVPSRPPVTVSAEALGSDVEKKLTLETVPEPSAPSSQKVIRFPDRPGFGQEGRKIRVRANHFKCQVATDKVLHHYDVRIFFNLDI